MSVLFRGALVAAALAIVSIAPAAAQTMKDGTAVVVTSKGRSENDEAQAQNGARRIYGGYGPTAIIMMDGENVHEKRFAGPVNTTWISRPGGN